MLYRCVVLITMLCALTAGASAIATVRGQGTTARSAGSDATPLQRLEVMRSRLERLRRTLNSSIAALNAKDNNRKTPESSPEASDPRERLRGLEREVGSVLSEVNDIRGKQERAERYEAATLDKLEAAITDLDERVQAGLRATASDRRSSANDAVATSDTKKKKRGFFGRLLGRGDNDEYDELIGTVAPGRDRTLFEEAAKQTRKGNYEVARSLFNVIITTYAESPFLPLAKLAIADTFYLEGTSSALIQAGQAYKDWADFFPTHPLTDDVYLKMAEAEMRQIGLPDRDVSRARKAEQRLKVLLQQFPKTTLREEVELRLREVQENLAMHDLIVGNQYYDRYFRGVAANPKGAQLRYRSIVENYPHFSQMDEVLYRLGVTYVQEEEPDEAAKYFAQLARNYPNSEYAEKAREQLTAIGVAPPEVDQKAAAAAPPPRLSLFGRIAREVLGTVQVTVTKDGVLIKKDGNGDDLIAKAIENGGQLPVTTPTAPVQRRAPARTLVPTTPSTSAQPANPTNTSGLSVQPTQPGPPPIGGGTTLSPTAPVTPQATTTTTPPRTTAPTSSAPATGAPTSTAAPRTGTTP